MNAISDTLPAPAENAMPTALVLTLDSHVVDRVGAALAGLAILHRADPDPDAALVAVNHVRPHLILVDVADAGAELTTVLARLRNDAPTAALVALGDETAADLILASLRSGAQDFVGRSTGDIALRRALRPRLERGPRNAAAGRQSPCLAVIGGRPADPAREVALAIALNRAAAGTRKVVFVDLGTGAQEAEIALDLRCGYGVADALEDVDRLDGALLRSALPRHAASGLSLLLLNDYRDPALLDPGDLGVLVAQLRGAYDEVVIHCGAAPFSAGPLALLAAQRKTALVVTQSLASAQAAARGMKQLEVLGIQPRERLVLAVADFDVRIQPSALAIAGTLGLASVITLPECRVALRNAENQGRFDIALNNHRGLARQIAALAGRLGNAEPLASPPGIWSRLKLRLGLGRAA